MFGLRLGGRRRTKRGSWAFVLILVAFAGWRFVAEPAMIRADEWTGTIVKKDTGRPLLTSSRNRRTYYYLTVNCGGEKRKVEVNWQTYNEARHGQRAVKVKGELWPRLR